jgi:hypothetical protein
MQVGAITQEKFTVLPFRMKIQGMALIVVPGNDLVTGIVLRSKTFFRVKSYNL